MSVLAGPFVIASALIVLGGAFKAVDPADTAYALRTLGLAACDGARARAAVRPRSSSASARSCSVAPCSRRSSRSRTSRSPRSSPSRLRSGSPISSCGCFGKVDTPPSLVHLVVDLLAAGCAITVALAGDTVALPDVLADQPLLGVPFVILAVTGIYLVFLSFTALPKTLGGSTRRPRGTRVSVAGQEPQRPSRGIAFTNWLVSRAAARSSAGTSRRGFIMGSAMVGSAVAVAGVDYALRPGTVYAIVVPGECPGGFCNDGYTEFCCAINDGINACPVNTFAGGWWRADSSSFCGGGTRYYIDCMQTCCGPSKNYCQNGYCFCESCVPCNCPGGCGTRKVFCNYFRYGQCHTEIPISGPIACRVVSCTPPYAVAGNACLTTPAVDNSTAEHAANCAVERRSGTARSRSHDQSSAKGPQGDPGHALRNSQLLPRRRRRDAVAEAVRPGCRRIGPQRLGHVPADGIGRTAGPAPTSRPRTASRTTSTCSRRRPTASTSSTSPTFAAESRWVEQTH